MTEHVNTGGNAFPSKVTIPDGQFDPFSGKTAQGNQEYIQMGMTMRDYFAAKALESGEAGRWKDNQYKPQDGKTIIENVARHAYQIADAMLRAREGVK